MVVSEISKYDLIYGTTSYKASLAFYDKGHPLAYNKTKAALFSPNIFSAAL